MSEPRCRLCGKEAPLVKAHVIPEAFFRALREGNTAPLLVGGDSPYGPKNAPIGVYDPNTMCELCERRFCESDTYGIDVLHSRFDEHFAPLVHEGETVAFQSSTVDGGRLLGFLASVLWRASVSTHPFYGGVRLGPYEAPAIHSITNAGAAVPLAFDAVLSRWEVPRDPRLSITTMLNPHRERWDGVNSYRMYFGPIVAYVKVDAQPFQEPFRSLSLRAAPPVQVVTRELEGSKDLRAMKQTVIRTHAMREQHRARHRRS